MGEFYFLYQSQEASEAVGKCGRYKYKSMAHGTDFEGPCFFQTMFTSLYEDWMSKAASATCCPLQTAFEYRYHVL